VVEVVDQSIYDLGAGTWLWTGDAELADEVIDIAIGRRPPTSLSPQLREVADGARLDESVFSLALLTTDGLRTGIRDVGAALGTDAGDRLAAALHSVSISVREADPFEWEVVADANGADGAREIAGIATDAGSLVAALVGSVGIDLGQLHPRVVIDGRRFEISGTMDTWTNRFEWSRPAPREPEGNPNVI
jgi:hypothetical protein